MKSKTFLKWISVFLTGICPLSSSFAGNDSLTDTNPGQIQSALQFISADAFVLPLNPENVNIATNFSGGALNVEVIGLIKACNRITGGADVKYKSREKIVLSKGFRVDKGSKFRASIGVADLKGGQSTLTNYFESAGISLYPNPASDFATINMAGAEGIKEILIYSIAGELLIRRLTEGDMTLLDLSELEKGIYILKVLHSGKPYTNRFTVN